METDPKYLLIPKLYLRCAAALPEANPELPLSYAINFGINENAKVQLGGDLKKSYSSVGGGGGGLGLEDLRRVKNEVTIETPVKKLSRAVWARVMGSAPGSAPRPGKVFNLFCWAGLAGEDEPIDLETGAGILVWHSFRAGFVFDGDFTANGDDYGNFKLMIHPYLGSHPGIWDGAEERPFAPEPEVADDEGLGGGGGEEP